MTDLAARISAHHVGARGFTVVMTVPGLLANDILHVAYEADAACAADMTAQNDKSNFFVLPYALGKADAEATLHITANPYGSSLYEPNSEYANYYGEVYTSDGAVYDAIFGEWCKIVSTVPVQVRSLDSLNAEGILPAGGVVDFLSLDTQGSEADIISGAEQILRAGVLAVVTEIEFHRIYKNQPLFSTILEQMDSHGLQFAGFTHIADEISPYRAPLGQRGRSFLAFGDALFLRRLSDLPTLAQGSEERLCELAFKAAFIALVFGFVEYALAALDIGIPLWSKGKQSHGLQERSYANLLIELQQARTRMSNSMLQTQPIQNRSVEDQNSESVTGRSATMRLLRSRWVAVKREIGIFYDSLNRYVDSLPHRRIRHLLRERPAEALLRCFVYSLRLIDAKIHKHSDTSASYPHLTQFEQCLERHGLDWVCSVVRRRRLRTARFLP
jgi:FkbM family methyltransferase